MTTSGDKQPSPWAFLDEWRGKALDTYSGDPGLMASETWAESLFKMANQVDTARQQVEAQHAEKVARLVADINELTEQMRMNAMSALSLDSENIHLRAQLTSLQATVTAREQETCVWREERVEYGNNHARDEIRTSCGLLEDADEMRPLMEWPYCPQCGKPLEITRLKGDTA